MSYCPRPTKTSKTNYTAPGTKTVTPGALSTESCGPSQSTVVGGGGSNTSTTVTVPGPAGPTGPQGPKGDKGDSGSGSGRGFEWKGDWTISEDYYAQSDDHPLASVVNFNGTSYVAIADNISNSSTAPEHQPDTDTASWQVIAAQGTNGISPVDKTILDHVSDAYDWLKNASLKDLLKAGAIAAGVIWAGIKIKKMLNSGLGDGKAGSMYQGTPGTVIAGFTPPSLRQVLTYLCSIQDINYDVTAIDPAVTCTFTIGQVVSIRDILNQLALAYTFEMVDTGGVLRFVPRSASPVLTLPLEEMGVSADGSSNPAVPYQSQRYQGIDLPKQVVLTYYSETADYNTMTQTADLDLYDDGQVVSLSVPVTLTDTQAKKVAELSLIQSWLESKNYAWTTTYKYIQLEPGDVIDSPMGLTRITKIEESDEGILSFTGVDAGAAESLSPSNLIPVSPPTSTNVPTVIGYSQAFYLDPNNIDDTDTNIRLKVAVHGYDEPGWPGADIYVSTDGGATSMIAASALQEATVGVVSAVTPAHDYHTIDNTTVIQVQLRTNSLVNATELSMMNGANLCMVGQEMMAFETATLVSAGIYNLTGLLRGRQGTEQYIGTHQADELFVMLDDKIVEIDWQLNDRFTTKKYKVVTKGSSPDKADWEDVYMVSNNTLMWPVYGAKALLTGNDITFSWKESVRYDNSLKDLSTAIHDPDWAGWGILIYAADGVTIKRTITPITVETYVYTQAMQIADFGVAQTTVKASITQISNKYGPGYPVAVSL